MTDKEAREALIKLWLEKAEDSFRSAELELKNEHLSFAVNRLYYACFYAVTALLLQDEKQFSKHSAVKSEFARSYVKTGRVEPRWHKFYQKLFDDRQEGDYLPTAKFDKTEIAERLAEARSFLEAIHKLIQSPQE